MTDANLPERAERPPFKLDIGRIGVVVAVPVICWAFYTTANGMVDIMRKGPDDLIGPIGAVIGSAAVLAMLALTSWSLGTDLGALLTRQRGARPPAPARLLLTGAVFAFVFSISAFFSFTYYYNNIFALSSRHITNEGQPLEIAREILIPLQKAIKTTYEAGAKRIIDSSGAVAYLSSIEAILKAASSGGENFREQVRAANAEGARQAQARRAELQDLQDKIAKLKRDIAGYDEIIKSRDAEIAQLELTEKREQQAAADSVVGRDESGKKGCSTICLGHQTRARQAREEIDRINGVLPRKARANADRDRAADEARVAELQQRMSLISPEALTDPAATLRLLGDARDRFRLDPTSDRVREVKAPCELILKIERQLGIAPAAVPVDFACEPMAAETAAMLAARSSVLEGRASFERSCALDGEIGAKIAALIERIRRDRSDAVDGLAEGKEFVDACILAARATGLAEGDVQRFLKDAETFQRGHTRERNRFEHARQAFWAGTPDSSMAIGVAVAQDITILVLKLLAEIFGREAKPRLRAAAGAPVDIADRDQDLPETRALKALLREAQPARNDASVLDLAGTASLANLPGDVQDNLKALLNRMVRQGQAQIGRKGAYLIDNAVLHEFEAQIGSGPGPRVTPAASVPTRDVGGQNDPVETPDAERAATDDTPAGEEPQRSRRRRRGPLALRHYFSAQASEEALHREAAPPQAEPRSAREATNGKGMASDPTARVHGSPSAAPDGDDEVSFDSLRARRRTRRDT